MQKQKQKQSVPQAPKPNLKDGYLLLQQSE